jgi:hypothetical protein
MKIMKNYYKIKGMDTPSREMYNILANASVLLIGTARSAAWATSVDIDSDSPADIIADGCNLPFRDQAFDYVILDYVTNFLPKDFLITRMIKEANRVGAHVVGRATITPGRKISLPGPKQRFTHPAYPPGVRWIETKGGSNERR